MFTLVEQLVVGQDWKIALEVVELMLDHDVGVTRAQRRAVEALVQANPRGPALEVRGRVGGFGLASRGGYQCSLERAVTARMLGLGVRGQGPGMRCDLIGGAIISKTNIELTAVGVSVVCVCRCWEGSLCSRVHRGKKRGRTRTR